MGALDRIKNIARGIVTDPPVKKKPGVVSDMFLPSPEEQLRNTMRAAGVNVAGIETAKQEALKDYDAKFNESLKEPGVGKTAYRIYNKVKEVQQKLPYVAKTLSEVVTSPFDVGFKLAEAKDERRNLLLNKNQKNQQNFGLASAGVDFLGLATLGGTTVVQQGAKTAFNLSKRPAAKLLKNVLPSFAAYEVLGQKVEDEVGYRTGLKKRKSK